MTLDVNDYSAIMEAQAKAHEELGKYDGNFGFLLEMKSLAQDPDYLFSPRQLEAILKSLVNHYQKQAKPAAAAEALLGDKIPSGTSRHAVMNAQGHLTFIRIDRPEEGNWAGWYFVKQIVGPMEERLGAQRPDGSYKGQFEAMLREINSDPLASIARYGHEIGKCGICGLRLTDELSRERGIGPICWDKLQ